MERDITEACRSTIEEVFDELMRTLHFTPQDLDQTPTAELTSSAESQPLGSNPGMVPRHSGDFPGLSLEPWFTASAQPAPSTFAMDPDPAHSCPPAFASWAHDPHYTTPYSFVHESQAPGTSGNANDAGTNMLNMSESNSQDASWSWLGSHWFQESWSGDQ